MRSGLTGKLRAALLGATVLASPLSFGSPVADAAGQPEATPADSAEKELEPAAIKVREGRIDEALSLIKEKGARHPEWPPAQLILARLLFSSNQGVTGRRALEQAAALAPDYPDVYLVLGELALGEGRLSDARLNFENALALTGAGRWDAERARDMRRGSLAGLAAVSEAREDWEAARARLNAWLELEPKNGQARQRLGRALFLLDKAEDAFAALTQAAKDAPALEPAAVSMALLYTQKGDLKKAEEWFDRARRDEPASAQVRIAHAGWLLDRGQTTAARSEIEEAVKLDPASKEAQKMQGLIAWHLRDLAGAERIFELMHRDAPADLVSANLLALALIEQEDKAKRARGLQLAEANSAQFPRSHDAIATLGWALYREGRLDQAEEKLRVAISGARTTPDIVYYLARVMIDRGRADDARKLLETMTSRPGAFAHRDDAVALLKTLTK